MKTRRTYTPIRIDFTPFVDVAFLMLTFFMLIKTVQRLNQMNLELVDDRGCYESFPTADAHLFLLANNQVGFLTYHPDGSGAEFLETDYSAEGLRKQLMHSIPVKRSIVLITPTSGATFKNIVDVFDELQIQRQMSYRLIYGVTLGERKMLLEYERYKDRGRHKSTLVRLPIYPRRGIDTYMTRSL